MGIVRSRPRLRGILLGWSAAYLAGGTVGLAVDIAVGNWFLLWAIVSAAAGVHVRAVALAVRHPPHRPAAVPAAVVAGLPVGALLAAAMLDVPEVGHAVIVGTLLSAPTALVVEMVVHLWLRSRDRASEAALARRAWQARRQSAAAE